VRETLVFICHTDIIPEVLRSMMSYSTSMNVEIEAAASDKEFE